MHHKFKINLGKGKGKTKIATQATKYCIKLLLKAGGKKVDNKYQEIF